VLCRAGTKQRAILFWAGHPFLHCFACVRYFNANSPVALLFPSANDRLLTVDVGYYTHGETYGTEELTGKLFVHLAADSCLKMILEWKISMTVLIAGD
jgi:hypothetical protein